MQDFLEGLSDKPFDFGSDSWSEPEEFSNEFPAIAKGLYDLYIKGFSPTKNASPVYTKDDGTIVYVTLDFVIDGGKFDKRYISFQKVFAATREGKDGIVRSGIIDLFHSFGLAKPASQKDVVVQIQKGIDTVKRGRADFDQRARCQKCADERTLAIAGNGNLEAARKMLSKEQNKQVNKYATVAWHYDDLPLLDPKDPAKGRSEYKVCPRHNEKVRAQGNIQRFLAPGQAPAKAGFNAESTAW